MTTMTTTKMGSSMKETIKEELRESMIGMRTFVKNAVIFAIGATMFIAGFSWVMKHNQFMPILHEEVTNVTITMMETLAKDSAEDWQKAQTFGDLIIVEDNMAKYSFFLDMEQLNEFAKQPTESEAGYADINLLRRVNWLTPNNLSHIITDSAENDKLIGAIFTVTWPIDCPQVTQNYLQLTCGKLQWSFNAATQMLMSVIIVTYILVYIALLAIVMFIYGKFITKCHKNQGGE